MHALRQNILPPSGVEYAASLKLTPSTVKNHRPSTSTTPEFEARALCNVVVARSNVLRIFEVREERPPMSTQTEDERDRRSHVRKGTEAVEGEVEMDGQGEGYVNMGTVKKGAVHLPTVSRFYFVREHMLHGTVTGLETVRIMSSNDDNLDRLLVSFKDAKIALLEWSDDIHDLITVSIHTYERAPQLMALDSSLFHTKLRVDPSSRCAALSLPKDAIAILPFFQSQAELDVMEQDQNQARDVPYSPSFILDLASDVDENIRHVIDFVFLPGFNNPTIAVLFQTEQTWSGRLKEFKDTAKLIIFTLDLLSHTYPVITAVDGLPFDCISLVPCVASLGGVVIMSSNTIIYVDPASRRVALPVNGWSSRVSDMPMPALSGDEASRNISLEGCHAVLVDDRTMFVFLKDGTVYPVELVADGKTVSKLSMAPALAQTTIPSMVRKINEDHLFLGSIVGASVLLKTVRVEEEVEDEEKLPAHAAVVDAPTTMDLDDDDDTMPSMNGVTHSNNIIHRTRSVVHLSLCDSLPAYGPISDVTFSLAKLGDRYVPELVAATGSGFLGGFTLFQRDLPSRTKRKLHAIGGARGIWSFPVRQQVRVNGLSYERPVNSFESENDTVIISTDANPSPGVSRIATRTSKSDIAIPTRIPGTTIGAGSFFQRTAILHVMTNAIRVLESGKQIIKDLDGNIPRPRIKACSICDPFVLIIREDDTIGLFIGEAERGKIRRKDMSPMGDKSSRYLAGCFFTDNSCIFETHANDLPSSASNGVDKNVTSTMQAVVNSNSRSQWLILVRPQGVMEIWTLPKLTLAFSTSSLAMLEHILSDSYDTPALSPPQDHPRKSNDLDVEQIILAPLGETAPLPYLLVFLRSGQIVIYEAVPTPAPADSIPPSRVSVLKVKFIKTATKIFELPKHEETEKSILAEQKRISRQFVPFVTSPTPGSVLSGVFFTGDRPSWIVATNKGGIRIYSSGHHIVHSFTSCSLWESKGDFLVYSDEGPSLLEWMPDLCLDSVLPSRNIPRSRAYANVVYDPSAMLIVAASSMQANFASFDEDGNIIWEPEASNVSLPKCDCSTLELIAPEAWITMDGYEFAPNEYVNALECVTLETLSTETGSKDFIAVGTSIDRGEDLAVKGATYLFEIVEVVPDYSQNLKRWYKLKLLARDDAKGPVTALCGINGYLVSSMGQKIFIRAFDMDERLVGVAFLDVGVYVTSLRVVKNFLLIGDAVKSIWFVAFQEDPYKLVVLAKDVHRTHVTNADFFFTDDTLSIVTEDGDGILRMYAYDPDDPESKNGQHLLCRTEFHNHSECRSSLVIARRTKEESVLPQAKILSAFSDGSLSSLTPVDDASFKRLQLLQGQLTRNIQHVAGLNPRAYRIVRNDFVSKPLSKDILDGQLLSAFESLPISRQNEMTKQIGTERNIVLHDWMELAIPW
ncbi:hypothetical protein SERLADRAFT_445076 [Serpula lacrymans var. lacrymans S7.9]|uniref:DNA damage-binding protein 1 n=1 Tax=Serpula lacrymans var. lacrymans (strain S7.9) TaxID=578457 RepID=F8NIA1_SERL9|nr:uncharacterized protein SERLADRAFT_445076 [Serpula lacrymans var. lacrymans S7.9]EGO29249.1 hypothetical protein SERLADRAFT_445076 [Serpula lacrymans var. lacrymans S7.9]